MLTGKASLKGYRTATGMGINALEGDLPRMTYCDIVAVVVEKQEAHISAPLQSSRSG
jgi:hypothetical protein